jgi:hypothetical protein
MLQQFPVGPEALFGIVVLVAILFFLYRYN